MKVQILENTSHRIMYEVCYRKFRKPNKIVQLTRTVLIVWKFIFIENGFQSIYRGKHL